MSIPPITWTFVFIAFCVVITIQVCYYLFIFLKFLYFRPLPKQESQDHPVTVVVCARDEADNIVKNLPGILVQDYKTTHEIIVVNDNSLDESEYLLDELKKTFKNLNHIQLTQEAKLITGKKFPLSIGIKSAKHEIILLTDADCVPASEHWIQKMQEAYRDNIEIVLGYGAYQKRPGFLNKLIRFETFHTALQYFSYALAGLPYMGVGRNLSYKKEVFIRNKGFASINHIPSGDDDLFINKVANKNNTTIVIDPDAFTLSEPKRNFKEWMRQKYRHYSASKFYKFKHKILLGLYSFTQFLVYPLFIVSLIFYTWWLVLIVYGVRFILQMIVYFISMNKLNEKDLKPYFLIFDIWMFFYYIFFLPALWKRPRKNWN